MRALWSVNFDIASAKYFVERRHATNYFVARDLQPRLNN